MPLSGDVITEMEAVEQLARVGVFHVAAGGISGGEGSVALLVKGEKGQVERIVDLYAFLKKETGAAPSAGPALCSDHKWQHCAAKNIYYAENVKEGK